jgi:alpha-glucosidase
MVCEFSCPPPGGKLKLKLELPEMLKTRAIRALASAIAFLTLTLTATAIDLRDLTEIGPLKSWKRTGSIVEIECQTGSRFRLHWLAPDLVRVRVAFKGEFPQVDHSWAVSKSDWSSSDFQVVEDAGELRLVGQSMQVRVEKSSSRIRFCDASGSVINQDAKPMMWDSKGARNAELFDPKSGPMVAATKDLGLEEHYYGFGEKSAKLDRRRKHFTMWNSDTPAYLPGKDPIYQSIPFYLGLNDSKCYGIFFDNSHKTQFDMGFSTQEWTGFSAEGGELNYYFFNGPSMKNVIARYTELTGRMPMPARWALGHQASRWSYYPESMVEKIVDTYQSHDLPLDVMTLDIDYMQKYRVFTWDTQRFPKPSEMISRFKAKGIRVITIVDPGVKYQPNEAVNATVPQLQVAQPELADQSSSYYVFQQGLAQNFFLTKPDGQLSIGDVWPGKSVFVDFTKEKARQWWGDLHRAYLDQGVSGIWNDMNEPADFIDQTGGNLRDCNYEDVGQNSKHAKNRNVTGLLMAKSCFEGLQRLRPQQRPFVITRAAYAGIQRYSSMWTGDAPSTWEGLQVSIPLQTSLGLTGQSFVGCDVGGFMGATDGEMMVRAYQANLLTPFLRNHKDISSYDQEPWRYGPFYEGLMRNALKLRYRLMPYLYGVMEEAHRTGIPALRPMVLEYQNDSQTWNMDDQFMVGDSLLMAPVLRPQVEHRLVYLPKGVWYDFWSNKRHQGPAMVRVDAPLEKLPIFVKGGTILPMGPAKNTTAVPAGEPLELRAYADANGDASGELYEDDGETTSYQNGQFARQKFSYSKTGGFSLVSRTGSLEIPKRPLKGVYINGQPKGKSLEISSLSPTVPIARAR